jgi:hypothetical protein
MNLLLHAESRNLIRRLRQNEVAPYRVADPLGMLITLDDEIFEELGYFGALAEKKRRPPAGSCSAVLEWLNSSENR